mmetsp:Transcript_39089/g.97855  ORF Transcript_39089/g.97855 Transcript_39089/m.97855 type:complete len:283 (+) Transcript_39089:576-1424(+)
MRLPLLHTAADRMHHHPHIDDGLVVGQNQWRSWLVSVRVVVAAIITITDPGQPPEVDARVGGQGEEEAVIGREADVGYVGLHARELGVDPPPLPGRVLALIIVEAREVPQLEPPSPADGGQLGAVVTDGDPLDGHPVTRHLDGSRGGPVPQRPLADTAVPPTREERLLARADDHVGNGGQRLMGGASHLELEALVLSRRHIEQSLQPQEVPVVYAPVRVADQQARAVRLRSSRCAELDDGDAPAGLVVLVGESARLGVIRLPSVRRRCGRKRLSLLIEVIDH